MFRWNAGRTVMDSNKTFIRFSPGSFSAGSDTPGKAIKYKPCNIRFKEWVKVLAQRSFIVSMGIVRLLTP